MECDPISIISVDYYIWIVSINGYHLVGVLLGTQLQTTEERERVRKERKKPNEWETFTSINISISIWIADSIINRSIYLISTLIDRNSMFSIT